MNKLLNKFLFSLKHCHDSEKIKSFDESQKNDEAFDTIDRGACSVPLKQIVGSVGRYHDFDSSFRLKRHIPLEKLQNIRNAIKAGKPMPRVKLYKIKDDYYVLDGNHRVAVAKEFGFHEIEAKIVEFIPSKKTLENILYCEKSEFRDKTGLPYPIELTEVEQYAHLIKQIIEHQDFLGQSIGNTVSFERAAADWYETIFNPLIALIEKARIVKAFPNRTNADLYTYVTFHQWEKASARNYGSGIDQLISKSMEEFREKMANKKGLEYPEMRREITAFILLNVSAKREYRIVDKLFAMEEVMEVHSVHGDVDILVKIVLTRDLVSSDAEIIGDFVHNRVRQIPGVISSQTLIPGLSKMKKHTPEK
jgi:DNA-binding Lrp family transcriptional regulator